MKQHQGKIIAVALILCALTGAYLCGGNYARGKKYPGGLASISTEETGQQQTTSEKIAMAPTPSGTDEQKAGDSAKKPAENKNDSGLVGELADTYADKSHLQLDPGPKLTEPVQREKPELSCSSKGVSAGLATYSEEQGVIFDTETGKDKYFTDPVPAGKPIPVEPQATIIKDNTYTCILSVRCDTILENIKLLDKEKVELVPADGIIFPATEVIFYEGENVFNLLQREMKKNKIHLEFYSNPFYNSAYICGINNLYEFDVGELSGWKYKVNGWFPSYGTARYQLKAGDIVEWVYSCDLGRDVSGDYAIGEK